MGGGGGWDELMIQMHWPSFGHYVHDIVELLLVSSCAHANSCDIGRPKSGSVCAAGSRWVPSRS